ncbi:MAG: NAD(P)-dependent oxidoreductase [Nitrospiraceae bacterium]
MSVAIVGTGLMGRAVAERLKSCGYEVVAYNRTREKAEPLTRQGIAVVGTVAEAVTSAQVVLLLLSDAAAIRAVLAADGVAAGLRGRLIVQMGTISPNESREIEQQIHAAGGEYIEAPVLGSIAEAKKGTLLVMIGGSAERFARLTPVLNHLCDAPVLVGSVGQAAAMKLALNQLIASHIAAFSLSLALLQRSGVSVEIFRELLAKSTLAPPMFEKKYPRIASHDYANPNFSVRMLLKDVRLVHEAAEQAGVDARSLDGIAPLLERGIALGYGDQDYAALYEAVASAPDVEQPGR